MNVLYIAPYRGPEFDGWANASRDYLKALATQPINLITRPIYLNPTHSQTGEFIEYESKSIKDIDVVIQKSLPHFFAKIGPAQHIGLCVFETFNLDYTNWPNRCGLMDKMMTAAWQDNFRPQTPVYSVGQPIDLDVFNRKYEPLAQMEEFVFYFIGENTTRKNWLDLVMAFHLEFGPEEPVKLILKLSGGHPQHTRQLASEKIERLKQRLRLYSNTNQYHQEILITDYLTQKDLCRLHATGNCFVMPSYGEAFCRPMVEAMGFKNQILVTRNTGMSTFVPYDNTIESYEVPCDVKDPPLQEIYTGRETWWKPSIVDMRIKMRAAFRKGKVQTDYPMWKFSYEAVGQKMMEAINESL